MITSINPFTQSEIYRFEPLGASDIQKSLRVGEEAFLNWRLVPINERCTLLRRAGQVLLRRKDELSLTMTREMGKPIAQARSEIEKCAWVCSYYADHAAGQLSPEPIETDASRSYVRFDPLGAILGIMPWNYPFWQVFRFAAPTLTAGNTGLLKHASNVWRCGQLIEEVFLEAGYPKGVFQHLQIGSKSVAAVLKDRSVRAVSLTGSEPAGSAVAELAGRQIKKSLLELGGSNAMVVFGDADMEATVATCLEARFQNTGQSCIAGKRLIVHESLAKPFVELLVERVRSLKSGNPENEDTYIGVMARTDLAEELERQMKQSLEMGARLACGGKRQDAYFEPTVLLDVSPGMPAFDEETFGPLLAVSVFSDEKEALRLVAQSRFGLGVSLFTKDPDRVERLIPLLDQGAVFVNELVKSDPRLPFGGVSYSGYGRELSQMGIREFVNAKTIYIANPRGSGPAQKIQ